MCRLVRRLVCRGQSVMLSWPGYCNYNRGWYHHSSFSLLQVPVGGDFVGRSATFHPQTGALIPIPEYMIPKSLLQWGQAPTSLEVFTSENVNPHPVHFDARHLTRQTWTLYPATDCGVENIQTMHHPLQQEQLEEEYPLENQDMTGSARVWSYRSTAVPNSNNTKIVESAFMFGNDPQHRVRMVVRVVVVVVNDDCTDERNEKDDKNTIRARYSIAAPVKIIFERQLDSVPTFGSRLTKGGGGLDAAQMLTWLGPILAKYDSFASSKPIVGTWRRSTPCDDTPQFLTQVLFSGNLTLSYGYSLGTSLSSLWILEMGHIVPEEQTRRVTRLSFRSLSDVQVKTWVESGEFIT